MDEPSEFYYFGRTFSENNWFTSFIWVETWAFQSPIEASIYTLLFKQAIAYNIPRSPAYYLIDRWASTKNYRIYPLLSNSVATTFAFSKTRLASQIYVCRSPISIIRAGSALSYWKSLKTSVAFNIYLADYLKFMAFQVSLVW